LSFQGLQGGCARLPWANWCAQWPILYTHEPAAGKRLCK
jgi:hypothetical protein